MLFVGPESVEYDYGWHQLDIHKEAADRQLTGYFVYTFCEPAPSVVPNIWDRSALELVSNSRKSIGTFVGTNLSSKKKTMGISKERSPPGRLVYHL